MDPTRLIIDTDMSTDVDDVAAVCIANVLSNRGETELLAVLHNTGLFEGVGAVSVINHYYGHDNVPIGAFKGKFGATLKGKYVEKIVQNFESPIKNYSMVPAAVDVYRQVYDVLLGKKYNYNSGLRPFQQIYKMICHLYLRM